MNGPYKKGGSQIAVSRTCADDHMIGGLDTMSAEHGGGWLFPVVSQVTHISSFGPSVTDHEGMRIR